MRAASRPTPTWAALRERSPLSSPLDPEENLELDSENLLVDTTALLKAILYQCDNRGPVTAKNECAGGVLGRGEVGAALSCTSMGPVGADDGSFAGGIAGLSRECSAPVPPRPT